MSIFGEKQFLFCLGNIKDLHYYHPVALRCLTKACNLNKKIQHLEYDKLNESPYLIALSPQTAKTIFKVRLGVFDIKVNFKDKYSTELSCAIRKDGRKSSEHILQCPRLPKCKTRETLKVDSLLK